MEETKKEIVLVDVTTKVTKEAYEMGKFGGKVMAVLGRALENGWQWTDVVDLFKGTFEEAKDAISGVTEVGGEFKNEPFKASNGILIPLVEGADQMTESLKKKPEVKEAEATPAE